MEGCKRSIVWYFDTPHSLRKWFSIQRFFYFTNTNASNSCPKRLVGNVKRKYSHQYVLITSLILPLCVHQPQSEKKHARVFNKICLLYVWGNKQQVVQVFFTGRTSPLDHNNQRMVLSKVSTAQLEWHKLLVKLIAKTIFYSSNVSTFWKGIFNIDMLPENFMNCWRKKQ